MKEAAENAGGFAGQTQHAVDEKAISALVRNFYAKARQDPLLGPVFAEAVKDWEHHIARISDFWSDALLRTERYDGRPFPVHMRLPLEPEHFPRWLTLFEQTARETLRPELLAKAIERGRLMAKAFVVGIFPYIDASGRPAREPTSSGEQ